MVAAVVVGVSRRGSGGGGGMDSAYRSPCRGGARIASTRSGRFTVGRGNAVRAMIAISRAARRRRARDSRRPTGASATIMLKTLLVAWLACFTSSTVATSATAVTEEDGYRCTKFIAPPDPTVSLDAALAQCDAEASCVAVSRSVLQEERELTKVERHFRGKGRMRKRHFQREVPLAPGTTKCPLGSSPVGGGRHGSSPTSCQTWFFELSVGYALCENATHYVGHPTYEKKVAVLFSASKPPDRRRFLGSPITPITFASNASAPRAPTTTAAVAATACESATGCLAALVRTAMRSSGKGRCCGGGGGGGGETIAVEEFMADVRGRLGGAPPDAVDAALYAAPSFVKAMVIDLVGHHCGYACAGKGRALRDVLTTACDGAVGATQRQSWPMSASYAFVAASRREFDAVGERRSVANMSAHSVTKSKLYEFRAALALDVSRPHHAPAPAPHTLGGVRNRSVRPDHRGLPRPPTAAARQLGSAVRAVRRLATRATRPRQRDQRGERVCAVADRALAPFPAFLRMGQLVLLPAALAARAGGAGTAPRSDQLADQRRPAVE